MNRVTQEKESFTGQMFHKTISDSSNSVGTHSVQALSLNVYRMELRECGNRRGRRSRKKRRSILREETISRQKHVVAFLKSPFIFNFVRMQRRNNLTINLNVTSETLTFYGPLKPHKESRKFNIMKFNLSNKVRIKKHFKANVPKT